MMGQVLLRRGAGLSDQTRLKGGGLQSVRQSQNIYQSQISIVLALYWHYAGIVLTLRRCRAALGVWRLLGARLGDWGPEVCRLCAGLSVPRLVGEAAAEKTGKRKPQ